MNLKDKIGLTIQEFFRFTTAENKPYHSGYIPDLNYINPNTPLAIHKQQAFLLMSKFKMPIISNFDGEIIGMEFTVKSIDNEQVHIENITIYDGTGNKGFLKGAIIWHFEHNNSFLFPTHEIKNIIREANENKTTSEYTNQNR